MKTSGFFTGLAVLVAACGYLPNLAAHTVNGSLGAGRGATDVWSVNCSDGAGATTEHLATSILGIPANASQLVSVQTYKDGKATNSSDILRNGSTFSPELKNKGGTGDYLVMIDKVGLGKVRYRLEFHCESAEDVHTTVEETQLQNR